MDFIHTIASQAAMLGNHAKFVSVYDCNITITKQTITEIVHIPAIWCAGESKDVYCPLQ